MARPVRVGILWFGNITNQTGTNDFDGDTLINAEEWELTATNVIFHSDPTLLDSDGDGMDDAYEASHGFLNALDPAGKRCQKRCQQKRCQCGNP